MCYTAHIANSDLKYNTLCQKIVWSTLYGQPMVKYFLKHTLAERNKSSGMHYNKWKQKEQTKVLQVMRSLGKLWLIMEKSVGVKEQIETFLKDWCCWNILLFCLVKHSFQLVLINYLIRKKLVADLIWRRTKIKFLARI